MKAKVLIGYAPMDSGVVIQGIYLEGPDAEDHLKQFQKDHPNWTGELQDAEIYSPEGKYIAILPAGVKISMI